MRRRIVLVAFVFISTLALTKTGAGDGLLAWRTGVLPENAHGLVVDIGLRTAAALEGWGLPRTMALIAASWAGWLIAPLALGLGSDRHDRILAAHPAVILMAAGGLGFAASALILLFAAMNKLMVSGQARDVPLVGLAMGFAALSVPSFELLLLSAASPLFLVAPRAMLERHMVSFYTVALLPSVMILAVAAAAGGTAPPATVAAPAIQTAGAPLIFAGPAATLALAWRKAWRLAAILLVFSIGIALAPASDGAWPILITGLGAAYCLHQRTAATAEIGLAVITVVAAAAAGGHIAFP